jgi:hypothetical protein
MPKELNIHMVMDVQILIFPLFKSNERCQLGFAPLHHYSNEQIYLLKKVIYFVKVSKAIAPHPHGPFPWYPWKALDE